MAEARILDSRKIPSVNPQRLGKFERLITYSMGPGLTFLIVLPDESVTDASIGAAIKADVDTRLSHVGKTYQV